MNESVVVQRYLDGESCNQLGRIFSCSKHKILRVIRKHGVALRSSSDAAKLRELNEIRSGNKKDPLLAALQKCGIWP